MSSTPRDPVPHFHEFDLQIIIKEAYSDHVTMNRNPNLHNLGVNLLILVMIPKTLKKTLHCC